jgi:hypothetical protein
MGTSARPDDLVQGDLPAARRRKSVRDWEEQDAGRRQAWDQLRAHQRAAGARSRPADALDARVSLLADLRSPRGLGFGSRSYHGVAEVADEVPAGTEVAVDELIAGGEDAIAGLADSLVDAPTFWVAPDMVDLVEGAAASMPDQPLLTTDLPSGTGFSWLPFTSSADGGWSSLRALAWDLGACGPDRVRVSWFLDAEDWCRNTDEDIHNPLVRERSFALFPARWHDWTLGRVAERSHVLDEHLAEDGPVRVRPALLGQRRFCQALWALMAEPYVSVEAWRPDRASLRRAQRSGVAAVDGLRVITLRRPPRRGHSDAQQAVDWSHRWIVNGHWRRQWYPAVAEHRLRYILPYVKGPDDRPLVVKDTVFALRR